MVTARESVERAGLDVGALLAGLTAAAKAELAAVYHYTILSAACAGLAGEELPALLRDIRDEDRRHFDALVTRMYELDGRLPEDIREFVASDTPYEDPLGDSRDLLEALAEREGQAVDAYAALCDLTQGRDRRTSALVEAIRAEEAEHAAWIRELLDGGPPGRFRRGFRGRSPFLSHLPDGLHR